MIFAGIIISLIWVLPIIARLEEKKAGTVRLVVSFLIGAFPVFLTCYYLKQYADILLENYYMKALNKDMLISLFIGGVASELLLLLFSWLVCRKIRVPRKIDYIIVFGTMGLGYSIMESVMLYSGNLELVLKAIFALEIFAQCYMGAKLYDFCFNRKRFYKIFLIPMVGHGLYDMVFVLFDYVISKRKYIPGRMFMGSIFLLVLVLCLTIVLIFFTYRLINKEIEFENEYSFRKENGCL